MTVAVHQGPVLADLARAREALDAVDAAASPRARFVAAHQAALRVAAAVLAARARAAGPFPAARPRNAWRLLAEVAPELAEWASYFAAGGARCDAAHRGPAGLVSADEADELLHDTRCFLDVVERVLAPPGPRRGRRP